MCIDVKRHEHLAEPLDYLTYCAEPSRLRAADLLERIAAKQGQL